MGPQHNGSFPARAPPSRRPYQRSGATVQRLRASSPAKAPKHPENFCFLCVRDRRPDASSHFLRQCPQLPERERVVLARVFEKAMQYRNQPQDTWPEKIESQTCNMRLMKMVEDFYDIEPAPRGEDQQEDYFDEEQDSSIAGVDLFAEDGPVNTSNTDVTLRSMTYK